MESFLEQLSGQLVDLLWAIPFFAILFGGLLLGKVVYSFSVPYRFDEELTERDNGAFGVHFALYLLGLVLAVGGTLYRGIFHDVVGLLLVAGFCILCVFLLRLSVYINDKLILRKFSIAKEMIQDRNVGTGFVVGGSCVATGLILNGALSIEVPGESLLLRIALAALFTLLFFAVGQILLMLGAFAFEKLTRYDVHKTIEEDDNMAAGISFGGFLVSVGIIVRCALLGAGSSLGLELLIALAITLVGMVLLFVARIMADRVLLPRSPLSKEVAVDKNPAAGAVAASCFICIALAFGWVITG